MKRANPGDLDKSRKEILELIGEECGICKKNGTKRLRFKLTVGKGELKFNNRVIVETMFLKSIPVKHLVDESKHFMAACFLRNKSSSDICEPIKTLCIMTYMSPQKYLSVDQVTTDISQDMRSNVEAAGITLVEAPTENPGSFGVVERYYDPLRCVCKAPPVT